MKTYFIVSDIHAEYHKLMTALETSGFDPSDESHVFVFGGDALDRGHEGDQVIRFLEELIMKKRIIGVLGNHDSFLLDFINGDIARTEFNMMFNGFDTTVRLGIDKPKISITHGMLKQAAKTITYKYPIFIEWLKKLPPFIEFEHHILVHGFLDFNLDDWKETPLRYAIWERGYNHTVPDSFEKTLIIGHTPNLMIKDKPDIIYGAKKIMIDGGAAYGGKINVLKLTASDI